MAMNETNYNKFISTEKYSLKKLNTDILKQYFTSDIITNIPTEANRKINKN